MNIDASRTWVRSAHRLVAGALVAATAIGALIGPAVAAADAATADYALSSQTNTQQQALGLSPDGATMCAVWSQFDITDPQVSFRRYQAGTGQWTPPLNAAPFQVSTAGGTNKPRCAVDAWGNTHVVWQHAVNGRLDVTYRMLPAGADPANAASWNAPITLAENRSSVDIDASRAAAGGAVWVVSRAYNGSDSSLDVRSWTPQGGWSASQLIPTGGGADDPRVVVDDGGTAHLLARNGGESGIVFLTVKNGAVGPIVQIPNGTNTGAADLAVNRTTGEDHVVYVKDYTSVYYARKPAGGAFALAQIASAEAQADDPTIGIANDGRLRVVYNDNHGGKISTQVSGDNGRSWSAREAFVTPAGGSSTPFLAVAPDFSAYVTYNRRASATVALASTVAAPVCSPPNSYTFCDVPSSRADYAAITALARRGIIRGYGDGTFGPDDTVLRAQMAALIARANGWDAEDWGNPFADRGGIDANLWRNVGTLAHYGVARGYTPTTFAPNDPVLQAQTISFITRANVVKGKWVLQPDDPTIYPNVPASSGHRQDLVTYVHYAGSVPDYPANAPWVSWASPDTRGHFARALYQTNP